MTGFEIWRRELLKITGASVLSMGVSSVAAGTPADSGTRPTAGWPEFVVEDDDGHTHLIDSPERFRAVHRHNDIGPGLSAASTQEAGALDEHIELRAFVSAPGQADNGAVPSDATLTIRSGVVDTSGLGETGVAGEDLTVSVRNEQNDSVDESNVTTGSNGMAVSEYDLSVDGRGGGIYSVEITDDEGRNTGLTVVAGPTVTEAGGFLQTIQVGREVTVPFLVRDGLEPVSGAELDLAVTAQGSPVKQTTATTDENGFASISFTPSTPGLYQVQAAGGNGPGASASLNAGNTTLANPVDVRSALVGEESFFGGYLASADGPQQNTEFSLRFTDGSQTYLDRTLTTDESGFFGFTYTLSEDIEPDFLTAIAEMPGGESIPLAEDFIGVSRFEADEQQVLTAQEDQFEYRPGQEVTIDIEAVKNGTPITEEEVAVFLNYGFQSPLAYAETVTTDTSGQATATFTVPEDAPDPSDLRGAAVIEVEGETFEDFLFSRVRADDIFFDSSGLVPGDTATISVNATDGETDDPISGVSQQVSLLYGGGRTGSFDTVGMQTGSDGVGEASASIPSAVTPVVQANQFHRYASFSRPLSPQLPGSLSASRQGQEIELTLDTPNGTTARGIVSELVTDGANQSIGTTITSEAPATVQIPEYISEDTLDFECWAADESGQFYNGEATVEITQEGSVTAALAPDPLELEQNSEGTLTLQIESASEGVGSYQVTLESEDTSVLAMTDVSLNGEPADSTVDLSESKANIIVDMGNNPFESGTPAVAEITVASGQPGEAELSMVFASVSNANGETYDTVNVSDSTVTVVPPEPPTIGDSPIKDPDGDNLFEDIDGDGTLTLNDVQVLYQNLDSDTVQSNAALFNFSGGDPSEVTIADLHALFEQIQSSGSLSTDGAGPSELTEADFAAMLGE